MSVEEQVEQDPGAVSEQPEVETQEDEGSESKMVPLSAMLATRKKGQDAELRAQEAEARAKESEAKAKLYQEYLLRAQETQKEPEEKEDPKGLVENDTLERKTALTKREILESVYQDMKPEAVQKIDKYLKQILEKKPWLASSIDTAQNRYARAFEIVEDYMHLVEPKVETRKTSTTDGQKIVQNSQKPRSPVEIGKSAQPGGMDYLKSIQGKKEFREYRKNLLQGG